MHTPMFLRCRAAIASPVLVLALVLLGSPAQSHAIEATKVLTDAVAFRGIGCNYRAVSGWKLPRGAHDVRLFGPGRGRVLVDRESGRPVVRVLGRYKRRLRGGRLFAGFEYRATRSACSRPDLYRDGWQARRVGMRVRFRNFERVFSKFGASRQHSPRVLYFGASQRVYDLSWHGWDSERAFGHGFFPYNNCRPNCAYGTVTPYRARVKLGQPMNCGGTWFYRRMRVKHEGPYGGFLTTSSCRYVNGTSWDRGPEVRRRNTTRQRLGGPERSVVRVECLAPTQTFRVRPTNCTIYEHGRQGYTYLRSLNWRGWGNRLAIGRGRIHYPSRPEDDGRATIALSRIRSGSCGVQGRFYTRGVIRVRSGPTRGQRIILDLAFGCPA